MKKERVNQNVLVLSQIAILISIIVLMAFTPIGYIKTAGLEITLITIPVIVGAIVLGPGAGAVLGGVFGATSFLQAVFGLSPFGVMMLEVSPLYCFLTCVPTRILMGLFTGLIFKAFKKKGFVAYSITSLSGSILNTILFMGVLILCYWHSDFIQGFAVTLGATNVMAFLVAFVGINGLVEALACFAAAGAISKAVNKYLMKI